MCKIQRFLKKCQLVLDSWGLSHQKVSVNHLWVLSLPHHPNTTSLSNDFCLRAALQMYSLLSIPIATVLVQPSSTLTWTTAYISLLVSVHPPQSRFTPQNTDLIRSLSWFSNDNWIKSSPGVASKSSSNLASPTCGRQQFLPSNNYSHSSANKS